MSGSAAGYASPLLATPGAVAGQGRDAGVAAHYGDPLREARMLDEGRAVTDLSHRGVVVVSGPDRLTWLHSLTTQHLSGLAPFESTSSLVLSPKGHIEHDLHLIDDGERTWITVEPGTAAALAGWLDSMRFLLRVEVADVSGEYAVLGDPGATATGPGDLLAWTDTWPGPAGDTACYGPGPGEDHPGSRWRWRERIVPRDALRSAVGERPLAGMLAAEALRVAAWRPRLGAETDHRTIPHELDWLRVAVHLHKGCYRGQETVARVRNLGRPPRRLFFAHLDGSGHVLPEPGTELTTGGRVAGRLTSVAWHYEDGPIGLGVVRRSTPADAVFLAGDVAVAQTPIVRA